MKSRKLRILCAFLASLMLGASFVSCAQTEENGDDPAATEAQTTPESSAGDETLEETRIEDNLPDDLDFGNKEIVILNRDREGWTSGEIAVEKLNSDLINDTVYERNKTVEGRLKIKIKSVAEKEHDPFVTMNRVTTSVAGGTHEYDIVACACYVSINQALSGTFKNLLTTDYVELTQPWWAQGFNEAVEYQGTQYVATGSALLSMYRFAFVTVFNKNMFKDHGVPYLYDDVKNKTWTLDRQTEIAPIFHLDRGVQGTQDKDDDIFGLATNDYISVDPYWSACDVDILGRDEDGAYELIFDSAKLHNVAEKVLGLFYDKTGQSVYVHEHYGLDDEQTDIRNMFANDGAAMATLRILELESATMRSMKSEFGVVPMPKYDDAQAEYRTFLHDQVTVFSIPSTISKRDGGLEMAGAVMEALASEGHYSVRPAYYETTLRTKIAKDPESAEMMDLIINNVYIDAGILYTQAVGNFHDKFRQIMGSETNTVTSEYKKVVKQVEVRKLPDMLKKLDKLANG